MAVANDPQTRAADPRTSSWVSANAGSGKTSTLVRRVARLLLSGTSPERILCVTFTKAAAAEMQRRVFDELGGWAVMESDALRGELAKIDEADVELAKARRLFARALETPGGLQIETIHAFCERLLRRFPLEAGVSPGFRVIDDVEKSVMVREARALLADIALARPNSEVGRAYAHFSVALHFEGFEQLLASFETRRREIVHFALADGTTRVWRRCGFDRPGAASAVEATVMGGIRWKRWSWAIERLNASGQTSHRNLAATMGAISPESRFDDLANVFFTANGLGEARKGFGAASLEPDVRAWLGEEQQRVGEARERVLSARVAEETCHALSLARAYAGLYEGAKDERGGLDFDDLIERSRQLLTERADAAWVLYKLDGGIDHLLLDEAQDTSPDQWLILRALVEGFFADAGAGTIERTIFAVADEKQSIFSFQGAAPERFAIEYERYRALIDARGSRLATVPLHTSFRSTPEILAFVDRVFADEAAAAGLRPSGATIAAVPLAHVPKRPAGGSVELWPLEVGGKAEEVDVWAPVDAEPAESKNKRLARRIARTIKAIVDRREAVAGRDETPRPCAWSDFLILVRRRNALFHEIIRALKAQGVPVGGADRLPLSEHGVFGDLVALAWFVLYPGDELSLAGLLRGPFCDLGEEDLFDLAYERDGSLWATVRQRAPERAAWRSAADFLRWAIQAGRTMAPFDFYGAVLARLDGEGRSMRQRLLTRLSAEGEDALDAFMAEVLAAEERGARDLESFAAAMAVSDIEVKREQDEAYSRPGGGVRVMSVHGAKGLEAPIVILPDTSTRAQPLGVSLIDDLEDGLLWPPRKDEDCQASREAKEARKAAAERESSRLLYVALTRARDRLIVCGVEAPPHLFEGSWYDFVARAFAEVDAEPFALVGGGEGLRLGATPVTLPDARAAERTSALPAWVGRSALQEAGPERALAPSRLAAERNEPAPSPLANVNGLGRYRRGDLIHRLLQILPDLAPERRPEAAALMLGREQDLAPEQRAEMAAAALAVLEDPRFAAVFGPGSRAEVAIVGASARLPKGISGRMDRLLVEKDRILVVDFKTNRPAPERIEDADPAYIRQMAAYVTVLGEIYPGRRIEAALVWTDGPKLMPVPENLLAAALDDLAVLA